MSVSPQSSPARISRHGRHVFAASLLGCLVAAGGPASAGSPDPDPLPLVQEAVNAAWIGQASQFDADGSTAPPVRWAAAADVLVVETGSDGRPGAVRVDRRSAEEIERMLEATALATRLELRASLRAYALERAVVIADGDRSAGPPRTFWDWLGWTGPKRALVQQQPSFRALIATMREQSYRWLLVRARLTEPGISADERDRRTARALVQSTQWPFTPLTVAIVLAAREDPNEASSRTPWLCRAAAMQYAGARELRSDPDFRASLARNERMEHTVRALLIELDALNDVAHCGLAW